MGKVMLEVNNLKTKYVTRFHEDVYAVDGVSLKIEEGKSLGVAGESGCGKSTLALSLMGYYFAPLHYISGDIIVDGRKISGMKPDDVRKNILGNEIAYIPQAAMNALNPTQKIIRFVEDVIHAHDPKMPRKDIYDLAKEHLQITLALSLHGSTQEKRKRLMPVANKYELSDVLDACDYYFDKTGRRITFEYSLVAGVNDQPDDIRELTAILKRRNCHLNLIPVNPIKERDFKKPDRKNALEFKNKLEKNGINVTIRRERGSDIDGACGQLRRRHAAKSEGETDENICND